jgi:hypothetical protein
MKMRSEEWRMGGIAVCFVEGDGLRAAEEGKRDRLI